MAASSSTPPAATATHPFPGGHRHRHHTHQSHNAPHPSHPPDDLAAGYSQVGCADKVLRSVAETRRLAGMRMSHMNSSVDAKVAVSERNE